MTMSTDLVKPDGAAYDGDTRVVSVLPYAYMPMDDRIRYANTIAAARGLLPSGMKDAAPNEIAARVFLVFETGAMLGLHPMAALQGMDVIEGNVTISPQTFTALVRGAGHKLRIKETGTIGAGDFMVTVTLIRKDDPDEPVEASWSLEDSVQAGLVELVRDPQTQKLTVKARSKNGAALNHEKYPKDMTQWRALGRLARRGAADVTMGIGYFPEELEVAVTPDGLQVDRSELEAPLIAEITKLKDKADLAALWEREHPFGVDEHRHPTDAWTSRVDAEFAAQLARTVKDSRPPKDGAPGHTGDTDTDGPRRPEDVDPSDYDDYDRGHSAEADRERAAREADLSPVDRGGATIVSGQGTVIAEQRHIDATADARAMVASAPPAETDEEAIARAAREADEAEARRWAAEHPEPPAQPGLDLGPLAGR